MYNLNVMSLLLHPGCKDGQFPRLNKPGCLLMFDFDQEGLIDGLRWI